MRKRVIVFGVIASIAIISCGKLRDLTAFNKDFEYKETLTIPSDVNNTVVLPPGGLSVDFPKVGMATESKQRMEEYNTDGENITKVALHEMSMTALSPASQYMDFVDTIKIFLSGNTLGEQLVAYSYNIPQGQKTVMLDHPDLNLKQYFLEDSIYYRLYAHFTKKPDSTAEIEVKSVLRMTASVINK